MSPQASILVIDWATSELLSQFKLEVAGAIQSWPVELKAFNLTRGAWDLLDLFPQVLSVFFFIGLGLIYAKLTFEQIILVFFAVVTNQTCKIIGFRVLR